MQSFLFNKIRKKLHFDFSKCSLNLVRPEGLEPPTFWFVANIQNPFQPSNSAIFLELYVHHMSTIAIISFSSNLINKNIAKNDNIKVLVVII